MCIVMVGIKINILYVNPSVRMHQHDRLPYNSILEIYENVSKVINLLKIGKNMGHFLYVSF